jgi:hypothetical protein
MIQKADAEEGHAGYSLGPPLIMESYSNPYVDSKVASARSRPPVR